MGPDVLTERDGESSARGDFPLQNSPVDQELLQALTKAYLPSNYDFEVLKTARRLAAEGASRVALQLPEGLLDWGFQLAVIFQRSVPCVRHVRHWVLSSQQTKALLGEAGQLAAAF